MDQPAPPSKPAAIAARPADPSVVAIHPLAAPIQKRRRTSRALQASAILLTVAVLALALHRHEQAKYDETKQRDLTTRLAIIQELERAGNSEAAIARLRELINDCPPDAQSQSLASELAGQVEILELSIRFLRRATEIRTTGALPARSGGGPGIETRCEEALELHREIKRRIDATGFAPANLGEIRSRINDVRVTMASELLVNERKESAVRQSCRHALELLQRTEDDEEPSYRTWLLRSECQGRLGDRVAGDYAAAQANRVGPSSADDFFLRGLIALQLQNDAGRAREEFTRSLGLDPAYYPAHIGLLRVCADRQDWSGAVAAATACLALNPKDAELFYLRGHAHFQKNEYAHALADFDACLRLDGRYRDSLFERGRLHFLAARWKHAEEDFSATLAISDDPSAYRWRGYCRAMLGRHREGVEDAERAVNGQPGSETFWFAARTYGQCVRVVEADESETRRKELIDCYGKRAVELLHSALIASRKRADQRQILQASHDLDRVRGRTDFMELLREVEARDDEP